jgi:hypothetical protein
VRSDKNNTGRVAAGEKIEGLFRRQFRYYRHETCHRHASAVCARMRRQTSTFPRTGPGRRRINGVLLRALESPHLPLQMWRAGYLRTTHYLPLSTQGPSVAASVRRRLGRAGYPITATLITVAVIGIFAGAIVGLDALSDRPKDD